MNAKDIERKLRGPRNKKLDRAAAEAATRLVEEAASAGLMDVAYSEVDSPFGPLLVAATRRGLVRLAYPNEDRDEVLTGLASKVSPRVLESPSRLDEIRRRLDAYFERQVRGFDFDVDYSLTRGFVRKVLRATARIPYGELSTYRLVATRAGSPRASRAAGNALGSNPIPIVVPCHRVVHSTGGLGGYTGGIERKEFLLKLEGALD
ncbi:MAG: methylated-DNA--[protein]-cysteine S-methyltransferase [Actinomycetota bacterium]